MSPAMSEVASSSKTNAPAVAKWSVAKNKQPVAKQSTAKPSNGKITKPKTKKKSIRRSRSGCYTCRLRRKKCCETRPACIYCAKIGLKCDYKPPHWWISEEQRELQRERVKERIRQTKSMEKRGSLQEYMDRVLALTNKPSTVPVQYDFNRPLLVERYNPFTTPILPPPIPYQADGNSNQTGLNNAALPNDLSTPTFHNNLSASTFDNGLSASAFNNDLSTSTFNNDLSATAFDNNLSASTFNNDLSAPAFNNDLSMSTFNSNLSASAFNNDLSASNFDTGLSASAFNSDMSASTFNNDLSATGFDNNLSGSTFNPITPIDQSRFYPAYPELPYDVPFMGFPGNSATLNNNLLTHNPMNYVGPAYRDIPEYSNLRPMVEKDDRSLLDHFADNVIQLLFPVLEAHQQGPARAKDIFTIMQKNRPYLHCCLSASAIHLKSSKGLTDQMDFDIMRHRFEAISRLSRVLNDGSTHEVVLDATLGMIFYHCSVGESDDYLQDIPWSTHFKAVASIANRPQCSLSQFNISLITWIDILGATMTGQTPHFAHAYRTKHLSGTSSGLQQLMGCEDRVMYLISEIVCLETLKLDGKLDNRALRSHVSALTAQIEHTEPADRTLGVPYLPSGVVQPAQLTKVITALFRIAARLYLLSLTPDFGLYEPRVFTLVAAVGEILQCLPSGPRGFDRSLIWPLFIAGAHSVPYSGFRRILTDRIAALGFLGTFGCMGRMYRVLQEIWKHSEDPAASPLPSSVSSSFDSDSESEANIPSPEPAPAPAPRARPRPTIGTQQIHWRELMRQNNWNYLFM